ncbi:MAG: hypothetical protein ACP5M9_00540 [Candidatus Micrarchaeia archaeon]
MIKNIDIIEKKIMALHSRRDKVLGLSREIVLLSGRTITAIHADKLKEAGTSIKKLKLLDKNLKNIEKGFEYNSQQAHQEFVEAYSLFIMVNENRLPEMLELKTDEISYLLGLLDVVGELKRKGFDCLRSGQYKKTEIYYKLMLEIYDSTVPLRFANSILPDFRKKQDVARMQIERTGTELLFFSQKDKIPIKLD